MQNLDQDPLEVQQHVPSPHKTKSMLPSRLSFAIGMNVFGKIWIAHWSLDSLGTSSKG
jgi:hypothetical protein